MTRKEDIDHAIDFYLQEVPYLLTLPDYSEEDKQQMRDRAARLAAPERTNRMNGHDLTKIDYDADYLWECECGWKGEDLSFRDEHLTTAVKEILNAHIPSMSERDEEEIEELARAMVSPIAIRDGYTDSADLAIRTCHCGKKIDGFYEYVEHLQEVLS